MIGAYNPVREDDKFQFDGSEWVVTEVTTPEDAEPQCFLTEVGGDRERQYTEQFLLYGAGIDRL